MKNFLLIELSDKSPQPDSSSAGRLMCSLSFVLLCHLRSIYVEFDTFFSSLFVLCLRVSLWDLLLFYVKGLYVLKKKRFSFSFSLTTRKANECVWKYLTFPLSPRHPQIRAATCGNWGKRASTGKREKACSLTGSGYEKGKIPWANFSPAAEIENENKNVWKLTKFPIKDLTFFSHQPFARSDDKAQNPDQKSLHKRRGQKEAKSLISSPKRFQLAKNLTINNYPTRGFRIHQSALFFIGSRADFFPSFFASVIGLVFAEMKKCFNHERDLLDNRNENCKSFF